MEKIFVKFAFLFSLFLLLWITVFCKTDYIENENRPATSFSLSQSDNYFTDRLPFRDKLLTLNRDITLFLGKNEFSGAFFGKNGYVFSNEDVSIDILQKNLSFASDFGGAICIVPSKNDALVSALPRLYESGRSNLWKCASQNENYLPDVLSALRLEGANGKYIYYRLDHHLTSLGSYYLYKSLASALGYSAFSAGSFTPSVVKVDFLGSDGRKMLLRGDDKIALFRYKGDGDFITENLDTSEQYYGLYDYEKLKSSDPYAVFPIAKASRVRIFKNGEKRERLLLICDSYGDSLAPFLARHFDIDMVDVRYFGGSVTQLKEEKSKTLLCFGMDTLASKELLYKLAF